MRGKPTTVRPAAQPAASVRRPTAHTQPNIPARDYSRITANVSAPVVPSVPRRNIETSSGYFESQHKHEQERKESIKRSLETAKTDSYWRLEHLVKNGHNVNAMATDERVPRTLQIMQHLKEQHKEEVKKVVDDAGHTVLHLAVKAKNNSQNNVPYLLKLGADPKAVTNKGLTPFMEAAIHGNTRAMKTLLDKIPSEEKEAYVNQKDKFGRTAIAQLIMGSHSHHLVEEVRKWGGDLRTATDQGNTLLHLAAKYSDKDTVRYLIEQGLDPQAKNNDGRTPAERILQGERLSKGGEEEILSQLVSKPEVSKVNKVSSLKAITRASQQKHAMSTQAQSKPVDEMQFWDPFDKKLYGVNIDPDPAKDYDLFKFVRRAKLEGLEVVIRNYSPEDLAQIRDSQGNNLLHMAATYNPDPRVLEYLASKGVSPYDFNGQENPAYQIAMRRKDGVMAPGKPALAALDRGIQSYENMMAANRPKQEKPVPSATDTLRKVAKAAQGAHHYSTISKATEKLGVEALPIDFTDSLALDSKVNGPREQLDEATQGSQIGQLSKDSPWVKRVGSNEDKDQGLRKILDSAIAEIERLAAKSIKPDAVKADRLNRSNDKGSISV